MLCVFLCVCFHVVCVCVAWQVVLEDSTRFAEALDGAGVPVTLDVYPRMWHDWVMYSEGCGEGKTPGSATPLAEAEAALRNVAEFLQGCPVPK